jgi:5-methylcytosine-specific restriction endonuclease McrA
MSTDRTWEQARAQALQRAHFKCTRCGRRRGLVVHHLDEQGLRGPHAYDLENLRVLCLPCHNDEHGRRLPAA